jgi:hypothetical protein
VAAGVATDLTHRLGPMTPVLARLDPLLIEPVEFGQRDFEDLVHFVRDALLDPRARPSALCPLVPSAVPSGRPLLTFEGCRSDR